MPNDVYHLEVVTGTIYPNPQLSGALRVDAETTMNLLGLDGSRCRADRRDQFLDYINHALPNDYLALKSPFLFLELSRQGLLRV